MRTILPSVTLLALSIAMIGTGLHVAGASSTTSYNINTLAGKVASVDSTPGLFFGLSGFIEQEANSTEPVATSTDPITPTYVPNSNLDASPPPGTSLF